LAVDKQLEVTYQRRFSQDVQFRQRMWQVLCREFFQRYIPTGSTVLELAAGYCEFINNIEARHKIAVDLNSEVSQYAAKDVQVTVTSSTDLSALADRSVDITFTSNFFEHLTREEIVRTIQEVKRVLVKGGSFLILQPNIRFCQRDYWMFFDHITPLDDRSLSEALETNGFKITQTIVRFLPYTTKSRLPKGLFLIKAYLKLPLAWRIFGQQSFIVAQAAD
jgi:ubiquinone/menaquinone biosynthesis C-methylase UbiE